MPCKYGEHVISCGHGGFTLTDKHKHKWEPHWHMGYIIGRACATCGEQQHKSKSWCDARMAEAQSR